MTASMVIRFIDSLVRRLLYSPLQVPLTLFKYSKKADCSSPEAISFFCAPTINSIIGNASSTEDEMKEIPAKRNMLFNVKDRTKEAL